MDPQLHATSADGARRLGFRVGGCCATPRRPRRVHGVSADTLVIDGGASARAAQLGFDNFISWSGLDIGRDRGSPVSHYEAPFAFNGRLIKVTVPMDADQALDGDVGNAEMARQ